MRTFLFLVLMLGTLPATAMARDHIKLEAVFENAPAESLEEALRPLSSKAKLTVVNDGKATLYFDAEMKEVGQLQRQVADQLPKDLVITSAQQVHAEIPTAPTQVESTRLELVAAHEKARLLGVSSENINSYLKRVREGATDTAVLEKLSHATFTTSNGQKIPAKNLITATLIPVKRPIIVQ